MTPPIVDIPEEQPPVNGDDRALPAAPDSAASAIAATHTIPDYPALARHMGWEGKVVLHLSISPQGIVTAADVVRSSGYDELDQAAVSWVIAHWRYNPAIEDGSPVASETDAAVVFNLRNAG
ncbi:MAG: energy transducer TonB [Alphaproteobacteria bacterium]|nr:energy transducer TonB [Alphaproteobacteria bacterium]MBV9693016.1 energy transducer TonB [Alphaproteobacteria bacterium]